MSWIYQLTAEEEALAARVGWERQLPMLGQPERNRNYSEGDIWEAWQHMICAASEIAAARMLGMNDFEPHVNTFKNKLDIPGFEVRYSFTKDIPGYPKWSLRYKDGVDSPDETYILIVGGPEQKTRRNPADGYKAPAFRAVGWMRGSECADIRHMMPYGVGNYAVPIAELHDMADLKVPENV